MAPASQQSTQHVEPMLELEAGPELTLPLEQRRPNLSFVLRLRGSYTLTRSYSLVGLGLGAGVQL